MARLPYILLAGKLGDAFQEGSPACFRWPWLRNHLVLAPYTFLVGTVIKPPGSRERK